MKQNESVINGSFSHLTGPYSASQGSFRLDHSGVRLLDRHTSSVDNRLAVAEKQDPEEGEK